MIIAITVVIIIIIIIIIIITIIINNNGNLSLQSNHLIEEMFFKVMLKSISAFGFL